MRHLLPLLIAFSCLLTLLPGCEPKSELVQTSGRLSIEQDTVLFDTVFTTVTTVTKRLWVYNRNSGAVKTDIGLAGALPNTYSLIIDGDAGPAKSGVLIRGNDSILVLVKARLGETSAALPFLLADQLNFSTNGNQQNVKVVAYGQNAYFHRADIITKDSIWPNDKPHVIINSPYKQGTSTIDVGVYVAPNTSLTIQPGTRIYCHAGATMQIDGTLRINPTFNPTPGDTAAARQGTVRFQGDRLEADYRDVPGQWGGIFFTSSSRNNIVRFTEIKNANFGTSVLNTEIATAVGAPHLLLEYVTMRNISGSNPSYVGTGLPPGGIVGVRADIRASNCLLTNCGEYAVLGFGGSFNFNFCTFANYTPAFRRETAALTFSNALEDSNGTPVKFSLNISLTNSIVWGSIADELALLNSDDYYPANVIIRNNLLRTKEYAAASDAAGKPGLAKDGNVVNPLEGPRFRRTPENAVGNYDYRLLGDSPVLGIPVFGSAPAADLYYVQRKSPTVIGAYEKLPY